MSLDNKPIEFVSGIEESMVSRNMLGWLNTFPNIPIAISLIDYEFIEPGATCMALSLIQGTYIVERYINDVYIAEYQFSIIYRTKPDSPDARLKADELLNQLGDWATGQSPYIGDGLEVQELKQTMRSTLCASMEDGWEDHQIFMRMAYKVTPGKRG